MALTGQRLRSFLVFALLASSACPARHPAGGPPPAVDSGSNVDGGGSQDGGLSDAGLSDAGSTDGGPGDGGVDGGLDGGSDGGSGSDAGQGAAPQCFFQTAYNTRAQSWFGNAKNGYFIFIGTVPVEVACVTSKVFFVADHVDAVSVNDTYDVGLYCISGDCTPNQRYVHTGALTVPQFFPNCPSGNYADCDAGFQGAPQTLSWADGPTSLPAGIYAWGMGTDCNDGTGRGAGKCASGLGEGGITNTQTFEYKVFTENPLPAYDGTSNSALTCLHYVAGVGGGLPSSLCANAKPIYNAQQPHMIDFAIF